MSFEATWMQLGIIGLSEVSQKEKDKCHMVLLTRSVNLRALSTYVLSHSVVSDSLHPGFSVHVIFQLRMLEWVAISYSREYA